MNRRERRRKGGQVLGLDLSKALCARHLDRMPEQHPPAVGVALAGELLSRFLADPRIQAETQGGQLLEVGPAVEAHQPLCCYLGDAVFADAREAAIRMGT